MLCVIVVTSQTDFLCNDFNDDDNIQQVVKGGGGGGGGANSWTFPRTQHSELEIEQILSLEFYKSLQAMVYIALAKKITILLIITQSLCV